MRGWNSDTARSASRGNCADAGVPASSLAILRAMEAAPDRHGCARVRTDRPGDDRPSAGALTVAAQRRWAFPAGVVTAGTVSVVAQVLGEGRPTGGQRLVEEDGVRSQNRRQARRALVEELRDPVPEPCPIADAQSLVLEHQAAFPPSDVHLLVARIETREAEELRLAAPGEEACVGQDHRVARNVHGQAALLEKFPLRDADHELTEAPRPHGIGPIRGS